MCRHCFAAGKALHVAFPGRVPVPRNDAGLHFDWPLFGDELVDSTATAYLSDLLATVNSGAGQIAPAHADGDGSCLFHAVSRATVGSEVLYYALRRAVVTELTDNRETYLEHVYLGDVQLLGQDLEIASSERSWAPTTLLFALANVLKRPVVLFASRADMAARGEALGTGLYLPFRHAPASTCIHPLMLAWQNVPAVESGVSPNHFVSLCRRHGAAPPLVPVEVTRALPVYPATVRGAKSSLEAYIPYGSFSHCPLPHTDFPKTMAYRPEAEMVGRVFECKMFQKCVPVARDALTRLSLTAAMTKLEDIAFMQHAAADGLLAVEALVQHEGGRCAEELLYTTLGAAAASQPDDVCSIKCLAELTEMLPAPLHSALRVCVRRQTVVEFRLLLDKLAQGSAVDYTQAADEMLDSLQPSMEQLIDAYETDLLAAAQAESAAEAAEVAAAAQARSARAAANEQRWQAHLAALREKGIQLRRPSNAGWLLKQSNSLLVHLPSDGEQRDTKVVVALGASVSAHPKVDLETKVSVAHVQQFVKESAPALTRAQQFIAALREAAARAAPAAASGECALAHMPSYERREADARIAVCRSAGTVDTQEEDDLETILADEQGPAKISRHD